MALIKKKFSIKCVTGYGINALVDFDDPLAILAHLLVGSEGTLAFISHIVLNTVPLDPERSATLLLFESLEAMAKAIPTVAATGPNAVEFLDDASMQAVSGIEGLPELVRSHPKGSATLLVDYQKETQEAVRAAVAAALPELRALPGLIMMSEFSTTPESHARLWRVREELFGIVGGARTPGTTVLLEDMAVPLDEFAALLLGLESLFIKHGYTDPGQGVQFGHASAGNAHFVLTADFTRQEEIDRFMAFTEDSVALVADELHGSLKAEHGTGRAMAPFVAREWGEKAYSLMTRIKQLVDPGQLFNPGVLINDDPGIVSRNIKRTPTVSPRIDKCIECGFCEHVCPSRLVTLTPRGRIQASRKHAELLARGDDIGADELWHQFQHDGINTCAADGMCGTKCPVGINVAEYTAALRSERNSKTGTSLGSLLARRYGEVERIARGGLAMGVLANRAHTMEALTRAVHKLIPFSPVWSPAIGKTPPPVFRSEATPEVVYFPACVTRIMGSSNLGKASVAETVLTVAARGHQGSPAQVGDRRLLQPDLEAQGLRLGTALHGEPSRRVHVGLERRGPGAGDVRRHLVHPDDSSRGRRPAQRGECRALPPDQGRRHRPMAPRGRDAQARGHRPEAERRASPDMRLCRARSRRPGGGAGQGLRARSGDAGALGMLRRRR